MNPAFDQLNSLIAETMKSYYELILSCSLYCGRTWHTEECMKGIPYGKD